MVRGVDGRPLDDLADHLHGIHVDAGLGGAHVDGGAHDVGFGQCLRDGFDEHVLGGRHALAHERAVSADEVDADLLRGFVKRVGDRDEILGGLAAAGADEGDRGDGDALVDDRDAEVALDVLARGDEILRVARDFVVDVRTGGVEVRGGAIQQADAHCDGAHVELLLLDHLVGLMDLHDIQHGRVCPFRFVRLRSCAAIRVITGLRRDASW